MRKYILCERISTDGCTRAIILNEKTGGSEGRVSGRKRESRLTSGVSDMYRTSERAADGGVKDRSATHSSRDAGRRVSRGRESSRIRRDGSVMRRNARVNLLMRERGQRRAGNEREREM